MWEVAYTAQTFKIRGTYLYAESMQHKHVKWTKHIRNYAASVLEE
jgi:hypothetical protein